MLVIFPFEETFYRRHGVDAAFIGHPLTERVRKSPSRVEARQALGFEAGAVVFGILPGSRKSEVAAMLPVMLKAAELIMQNFPSARFIIPMADTLDRRDIDQWLKNFSAQSNQVKPIKLCTVSRR